MTERISGIYKIEFKNNEKEIVYVGQSNNIEARFKQHKRKLKDNKHHSIYMQNVYNKYSDSYFSFEILEKCPETELNEKEIYWIKEYDSKNNGFNSTYGGDGSLGFKHKEGYSEMMRQMMIDSGRNKKEISQYDLLGNYIRDWDSITDASNFYNGDISSIAKCTKGKIISSCGYIWRLKGESFEKYKTKQSVKKPVVQYSTNGEYVQEFESAYSLEKNGMSSAMISSCCNGKSNIANGYVWRFKGDSFYKYNTKQKQNKKIYQLDKKNNVVKIWNSVKELEENGTDGINIRHYCRGKGIERDGYKWVYEYDYINKTELYYKIINKKYTPKHEEVDKIDPTTYKIVDTYESINIASKLNNVAPSSISGACGQKKNIKVAGYYWRKSSDRIDGEHEISYSKIDKSVLQLDKNTKEIIQTFPSASDANEYFGRSRGSCKIAQAMRHNKTCDGFYWEKSVKEKYE